MTQAAIIIGIISIITGPLAAILISRYLENKESKKVEKLEIFKNLIAFQYQIPPSPHFLESINLIPVVFYQQKDITKLHNELVCHVLRQHEYISSNEDENQEQYQKNKAYQSLYENHFLNLLNAISQHLGYNQIRQTDMKKSLVSLYDIHDYEMRSELFETMTELFQKEIDKQQKNNFLNLPLKDVELGKMNEK